ncbi:MAG TPA: type II secretion system F family protein [Polyangiaceae bacterium]|nr:type II secretion system F family protein [Polyangiaceae bacterium]
MSVVTLVLKGAAALTLFSALAVGAYAVARAPSVEANTRGIRGLKRVRALRTSPLFAQVEPAMRWLGVRLRPLLPNRWHQRLDRQITLSGDYCGLTPEELIALCCLGASAGLTFGLAYAMLLGKGLLYAMIGTLLGAMLPYLQVTGIEQERRKRVHNGLPYAIDLLSLGLSAGLDFPGALRQVVEKSSNPSDPLFEELNLVLQELQVGKTRKDALLQFADRVPNESVLEFVNAVVQAEERGNPLGRVLQIQAEVSRQRRSVRAEEAASKASVKMLGPLVLLFAGILLLIVAPMILDLQATFGDQ